MNLYDTSKKKIRLREERESYRRRGLRAVGSW
jgi:hypothetical protein